MKIGIDIRALNSIRTGIGRYLETLLPALFRYDKDSEYILFYNSLTGPTPAYNSAGGKSSLVRTYIPNRILNALWAYTAFPKFENLAGKTDIFYSPSFQVPPLKKSRSVLTIHDIVFYHSPELAIPSAVRHYKRRIKFYADRADVIIADSTATANDIVEFLKIDRGKIKVIYPGTIPLADVTEPERSKIKNKLKLPDKYMLFVGCIEPRKNLARAFRAYNRSGLWKEIPFVLAGPTGWRFDELEKIWNDLEAKDRIIRLDYVTEKELTVLYENAFFFVFPSLFEGFGLPILEAMSAGCPVLTSNVSAMPEAAGDCALLVDPINEGAIEEGMLRLYRDDAFRAELARKGKDRAALFTWEKTAGELINIFNDLR